MNPFFGKVAAITGAGSGIGRALALRLAGHGCDLALSDIDADALRETTALLTHRGVRVTTEVVDVADRAQMARWARSVMTYHGRINLLFNNAGVAHGGTVASTGYPDYEWVLQINFWGVVHGTKEFLPYLIEGGEGHIVNISSVFGLFAQPMVSAYNASKFAVRGFTESLRQELDLADQGVSATCVHPGGIQTNIAKRARVDPSVRAVSGHDETQTAHGLERFFRTSAEHAAQTILRGVQRNQRRILIGRDAQAADLLQRILPAGYQPLVTMAMRWVRARKTTSAPSLPRRRNGATNSVRRVAK